MSIDVIPKGNIEEAVNDELDRVKKGKRFKLIEREYIEFNGYQALRVESSWVGGRRTPYLLDKYLFIERDGLVYKINQA